MERIIGNYINPDFFAFQIFKTIVNYKTVKFEIDFLRRRKRAYQNSDGSEAEQRGYIKNLGTNNEIQVMEGSYTYYDSEAKLVRVNQY